MLWSESLLQALDEPGLKDSPSLHLTHLLKYPELIKKLPKAGWIKELSLDEVRGIDFRSR